MTTPEPLRPPPDWVIEGFAPKPWEATITPSRHGYWITFHSGLMELSSGFGGWHRWTRRGAERCARRVIARENAEQERAAHRWTVR